MADPQPVSLAAAVEQAATLLAREPARAEQLARAIMAQAPSDPRARLIFASARRRQGDAQAAHAILAPLAKAYPNAANTRYELGACLVDLAQTEAALGALRHAVRLNPELAEAWRVMGAVLFAMGEHKEAQAAFAQHARASVRDPELRPAGQALADGRFDEAEQMLRRHLQARPDHAEALRLLGEALSCGGHYAAAEVVFARSLLLDPDYDGARFGYAEALYHQQKGADAVPHLEQLLARYPGDPAYLNLLAGCLGLLGEDARIAEIYRELLDRFPQQPLLWLNYGQTLRTTGRLAESIEAFRNSLAYAPGMGDAYWGLANLKVGALAPEDVVAMRSQLQRSDIGERDRLHLNYALGKALEDQGDFEASFAHYSEGARIRRRQIPHDAEEIATFVTRCERLYTPDFFAARAGSGAASNAPIFVVGLPRSGSTLIEQILASHSMVEGTMELPYVNLRARTFGLAYPDGVERLDAARLKELGEDYLRATEAHRKLGRPRFIDKLPNNFFHVGLIQLMLPNARIIDARRHPMGVCFSAFKQHFEQGQNFSYDLTDLGRFYVDYVRLMDHYDRVLPGRIHRVIYEDMVEDTEGEIRRLLDYCGLEFEEACLRFWETDRSVRTVSSEQVRRPIYRGGLEQWRAYEPWLGPLKAALGPVLEDWRGGPRTKPASAERTAEVNQVRQAPLSQA